MSKQIHVIAVDGGPCGGKTTAINFLQQKLSDFGFHVIVVNEMATQLITAGFGPNILGNNRFQEEILDGIIQREDHYISLAKTLPVERNVIILCDRGAMSGLAYTTPTQFERLLSERNITKMDLRDKRYDGVLFFRSVATEKPELYTTINNLARTESPEAARALDVATLSAWQGCQHLTIINNRRNMHDKCLYALKAVCRIVGIPEPLEIERKYLIKEGVNLSKLAEYKPHPVHIIQTYLKNDILGSERVRMRSKDGGATYYHTIKRQIRFGVRAEQERRIERAEYVSLLERADSNFGVIEKQRDCFVYNNQYFEMDRFNRPYGLALLEIELIEENAEVELPPFLLSHVVDVTNDLSWSNAEIAKRIVSI